MTRTCFRCGEELRGVVICGLCFKGVVAARQWDHRAAFHAPTNMPVKDLCGDSWRPRMLSGRLVIRGVWPNGKVRRYVSSGEDHPQMFLEMIEDYDRYRMGVVGAMPWQKAMAGEDRRRAAESAEGWLYAIECAERDAESPTYPQGT